MMDKDTDMEFAFYDSGQFEVGDSVRLLKSIRVKSYAFRSKNVTYLSLPEGAVGEIISIDKTGEFTTGESYGIQFGRSKVNQVKAYLLEYA